MMNGIETWLPSIVVAIITGLFAYLGIARTVKAQHDSTVLELKAEQKKQAALVEQKFESIQADIKRLEDKQDKHNAVIERTYKLEQKVDDLEKRIA